MSWAILFHDDFDAEIQELPQAFQDELLAHAILRREFSPNLGRPTVDGIKGSRHTNMKELRFSWKARFGASLLHSIRNAKPFYW